MGVVRMACAAAIVAIAASQVAAMPKSRIIALWASAGRFLGVEPQRAEAIAPAAVAPRPKLASAMGVEIVEPDHVGQFNVMVEAEGQRFPALVDTGASMVALTSDVAESLGYYPSPSEFRYRTSTANGIVAYAKVELRELRVGSVVVRDVPALVAPRGALWRTLLGMSFLTKLSSFRTDDGKLTLRQ